MPYLKLFPVLSHQILKIKPQPIVSENYSTPEVKDNWLSSAFDYKSLTYNISLGNPAKIVKVKSLKGEQVTALE